MITVSHHTSLCFIHVLLRAECFQKAWSSFSRHRYYREPNFSSWKTNSRKSWTSIHQAVRPQISWSLEAAGWDIKMSVSLRNLKGISAAALPRRPSNFGAIRKVWTRISWFRDFSRSCGKTSARWMNRGPGWLHPPWWLNLAVQAVKSSATIILARSVG